MKKTASRVQSRYSFTSAVVLASVIGGCGSSEGENSGVPELAPPAPPVMNVEPGPSVAVPSDAPASPNAPTPTDMPGSAEGPLAPMLDPGAPPAPEGTAQNPPPPAEPAAPAAPAEGTPVALHGQLRVDGTRLVGEDGVPVQLKGVSTMWLNWEPRYSVNRDGLAWMRDNWNVSVVRAAMGIEPEGAYLTDPELAFEQLRTVVRNAIDVGVYVLVDWHDHAAQEHLEQSVDFFTRIAAEFGEFPNVLYEPYNEPLNLSWSNVVKPYHEAVLRAIRAEDPDNVAILGTPNWSQRVDEASRDRVAGDNLMYTVHFYACDHRDFQRNQAIVAYDAGLPLFVTEWGATPADGGARNPIVCEADATAWLDWMDERSISWTAWKLDGCRDASCFFTSRDAPANGGWTDEWLNGHARFVVGKLLE